MRQPLMTERVVRGGSRKGWEAYLPGHSAEFAAGPTAEAAAKAFARWHSERTGVPHKAVMTIGGEYDLAPKDEEDSHG